MTTMLAESVTDRLRPVAPQTLEATGLTLELITDLVIKALHRSTEMSGSDIARRLGLLFANVSPSLDELKAQRCCEITGGPSLGGPSFRYRLTDIGHARALSALDQNQYVGVAPVPIGQYREYTDRFRRTVSRVVSAEQVRAAFSHLVVSDRVLDEIEAANQSGGRIACNQIDLP